ncbi:MAG: hypothetical protein WD048_05935 [Chitinophagales bacterium]
MKTDDRKQKKRQDSSKNIDAVKLMRKIRDKMDRDLIDMDFEKEKEYFKKKAEAFTKSK